MDRIKCAFHWACMSMISYSTDQSATIKSCKVGVIYRLSQLVILIYIIGWELIISKGYQRFDYVSSVVTTKVKGLGYFDENFTRSNYSRLNYTILDTAGYFLIIKSYTFDS